MNGHISGAQINGGISLHVPADSPVSAVKDLKHMDGGFMLKPHLLCHEHVIRCLDAWKNGIGLYSALSIGPGLKLI